VAACALPRRHLRAETLRNDQEARRGPGARILRERWEAEAPTDRSCTERVSRSEVRRRGAENPGIGIRDPVEALGERPAAGCPRINPRTA